MVVNSHPKKIFARICVVGSNFYSITADYIFGYIGRNGTSAWGNLLLFQTR
jgi:hypothetical protein